MQTKDVNKIIELNEQKYISEELYLSEITNSLLKLGFSPKLKGFIYIKEAIYYYSEISFVTNIRNEIYSKVAEKYNVSITSLNHSIKKAIEETWYGTSFNRDHELFNCAYIKTSYPPTNTEFIANMSECIKLNITKRFLNK